MCMHRSSCTNLGAAVARLASRLNRRVTRWTVSAVSARSCDCGHAHAQLTHGHASADCVSVFGRLGFAARCCLLGYRIEPCIPIRAYVRFSHKPRHDATRYVTLLAFYTVLLSVTQCVYVDTGK